MGSSTRMLYALLVVVAGCSAGSMGDRHPDPERTAICFSFGPGRDNTVETTTCEGIILGSTKWEYGPWEKLFIRKLRSHWTAPYAYRAGETSGCTTVSILVGRNGVFRSVDCRERTGQDCLHEASVRALNAMSGQVPLPGEFPNDELFVTLNLEYPALSE